MRKLIECTYCERQLADEEVLLEVLNAVLCDRCYEDKETFGVSDSDFLRSIN